MSIVMNAVQTSPARSIATASGSQTSQLSPIAINASSNRRAYVEESGLSPQEYLIYPAWLAKLKPAPSGQPGLVDEQDGIQFMREECGIGINDEAEILSLFERTPFGLAPGHFYALMRLVSWKQQGQVASKHLVFIQTSPAKTGSRSSKPSPAMASTPTFATSPKSLAAPAIPKPPAKPDLQTKPLLTPVREEPSPMLAPLVPVASSMAPPAVPLKPSQQAPPAVPKNKPISSAVEPAVGISSASQLNPVTSLPQQKIVPPPPSASANPFRDPTASVAATTSVPIATSSASSSVGQGLLGFDPAPNPFKQSKPRIVKPTPVRASSPASNPFRHGTPSMHNALPPRIQVDGDASSSSSSQRSKRDRGANSPPLPPRPSLNPPPLPPRISPLIQASLNARSEVRKAQQALPPKTFTVLQSSSSRHGHSSSIDQPRLLTGQAAPLDILPPPPQHYAKRRTVSGSKPEALSSAVGDSRRSVSDAQVVHRNNSLSGSDLEKDVGAAERSANGVLKRAEGSEVAESSVSQARVPTVVPKPSYAYQNSDGGSRSTKGKATLPSWLREQEELQREALALGESPPAPPPIGSTPHGSRGSQQPKTVLAELDEQVDRMSDEARAAATIERNNPFFPPHARDQERAGGDLASSSFDIARQRMETDASASESNQVAPGNTSRPLGRSKTIGSRAMPPPPRRRLDSFPQGWGTTLESGTYAGFKPNKEQAKGGGLRLIPPSKQKMQQSFVAERRDSSSSALSKDNASAVSETHSSSGNGALSPTTPSHNVAVHPSLEVTKKQASNASSVGSGFRDRVSDMLRLQEGPPKGQRPVDLLGKDIAALVDKHDWLARAAATAKGRPLRGERAGLMADYDGGENGNGVSNHDEDPPEPDEPWPKKAEQNGLKRSGSLNPRRSASYSTQRASLEGARGPASHGLPSSESMYFARGASIDSSALGSRRWSSYIGSGQGHLDADTKGPTIARPTPIHGSSHLIGGGGFNLADSALDVDEADEDEQGVQNDTAADAGPAKMSAARTSGKGQSQQGLRPDESDESPFADSNRPKSGFGSDEIRERSGWAKLS
ncbi:hypothetical protein IE53DRAFT_143207 [Violaceomyces palustris]|uniref:Uncharacterized protein n=1 Tax=Violaceomyces palustris TaxID=1673888 RepID=A0ACD0NUF5_9BASI|nr:hypothetical protein IE53DRAFT_143207 [Violaceomyces palustris]